MGMMVGLGGVLTGRVSISRAAKGSSGGAVQKTADSGKRKRVNYNYRAVTGRILRAKTSAGAAVVVTYARMMAAMLRKKYGSGEYDDKELEIAIIHAEKMVRIAKKKLKNLKMEERKRRILEAEEVKENHEGTASYDKENMQQTEEEFDMEELRNMLRELEQELRELAAENSLDELADECLEGGGAISEEDLKRIKKKHRCDEMRQIVEADMKYWKAMFEHMKEEQQDMAVAATLELSPAVTDTPVVISLAAMAEAPVEGVGVDASV